MKGKSSSKLHARVPPHCLTFQMYALQSLEPLTRNWSSGLVLDLM